MSGRNSSRSELAGDRYFLLVVGALLVAYTLTPFNFDFSLSELKHRVGDTLTIELAEVWGDMGHLVGFIVFGALLASVNEGYIKRLGFARFMLLSMLFCLALEFGQLTLPTRHARVSDLVVNAFGLWIGAQASVARAKDFWRNRIRVPATLLPLLVALVAAMIWVGAGILPLRLLSQMDWDRKFHLVIGAESDGDEGFWLGEIKSVRIHDRALNAGEVSHSYKNLIERKVDVSHAQSVALVAYDFTTAPTNIVRPTGTLASEGLALEIPSLCQWLDRGGGLLISEPARLISHSAASKLTEAMMAAREFSVEAWLRPLNSSQGQDGPARIISLSHGIWFRNFMLGQENSDMVLRVRNEINGSNGLRYALRVPNAFHDSLQHFVAIYDHGVSQIFRNGQLLNPIVDLRDPTLFVRLGNNAGAHAAAGILLVLTVALPMYSLCSFVQFNKLRHVVAILATFVTGSLPYVACCILVGGPWRWGLLLWLAIALCIAYPLCFLYVQQSHLMSPVRL